MNQTAIVESILFVASKPMRLTALAKASNLSVEEVTAIIAELKDAYQERESGLTIAEVGDTLQLVSHPACAEFVSAFREKDLTGDLTKAQLETLTVIAYQAPITRPEIEEIRGVNSAVILRTLLLRGLIEERLSDEAILPVYELTVDALRELGITSVTELPEYEALHAHAYITDQDDETYE